MPQIKMPGVAKKDIRDMTADDIRDALSDVRLPEVKLSDLDPRKLELPKELREIDFSRLKDVDLGKLRDIDLSKVDVQKSVAALAAATPIRQKRRTPWGRIALVGVVLAAVGTVVAMNLSKIRARAEEAARSMRERADAERVDQALEPMDEHGGSEPVAIPIESDPYAGSMPSTEQTTTSSITGTGSLEGGSMDGGQREDGEVRASNS